MVLVTLIKGQPAGRIRTVSGQTGDIAELIALADSTGAFPDDGIAGPAGLHAAAVGRRTQYAVRPQPSGTR